jgi:hypothetical protein
VSSTRSHRLTLNFVRVLLWAVPGTLSPMGRAQTTAPDPALLDHVRARMQQNLATLPNYTCDVNIGRYWRNGHNKRWTPYDRVQLSLTVVDRVELYGRRRGGEMQQDDPRKLVPTGTIGNGEFAAIAETLFRSDAPQFHYAGVGQIEGRAAARFDYVVPIERSKYDVTGDGRTARVPFHGSFWAAVDTLEVLRIELVADQIPAPLGLQKVSDVVEYDSVPVAGRAVLLPREGLNEIDAADGQDSLNHTKFQNCREYKGEARMLPGDGN